MTTRTYDQVVKISNKYYRLGGIYTQATLKCRVQLALETPLGEALVEGNSYPIIKTNNDG